MMQIFETTINIHSSAANVWRYISNAEIMKRWMGEPHMNLEIITDWTVGQAIEIRGYHHVSFVNKGYIIQFEPDKILQYSHLSSLSNLTDIETNYSIITFKLTANDESTELQIQVSNFPNEIIYKHLVLYWKSSATLLKHYIESDHSIP